MLTGEEEPLPNWHIDRRGREYMGDSVFAIPCNAFINSPSSEVMERGECHTTWIIVVGSREED